MAGGITVLLTGLLARRLGAGRFGQLLAQVCVLVAPVYLVICHIFSMNSFDVLFWLAAFYIVVMILDGGDPRLWIAFGLVAGLGLQNKITLLLLGAGLVGGLILSGQRRRLLSGWFWLGGALAGLIFLPYVLWQIPNGWPTLEFIENARLYKMVRLSFARTMSGKEDQSPSPPPLRSPRVQTWTSLSGSSKGRGLSNTTSTTLKMANPQRQRQQCHCSESRTADQRAGAVAQVPQENFQSAPSPHFTGDFLHDRHISEFAKDVGLGLLRRLAAVDPVLPGHGDVHLNLILEFPLATAGKE